MIADIHQKALPKKKKISSSRRASLKPRLKKRPRYLEKMGAHLSRLKKFYDNHGPVYLMDRVLGIAKHQARKLILFLLGRVRKLLSFLAGPFVSVLQHSKNGRVLRGLIKDQTVLIIGSGPSASELTQIPKGAIVFTCNAGLRLFVDKQFKKPVDLFLCRKKAMTEDYKDIRDLLPVVKTDVFIMDNPAYIKRIEKLNGSYSRLIKDHQKDNYYLRRLIRPHKIEEIKTNNVAWTSAGIRLLQYAIYYEAKEIYLTGIDLSNSGYFWGDRFQHTHPTDKMKHKHPIDHVFLRLMSKKFSNIYCLSKTSPLTKYVPYKNPWSSTVESNGASLLQEPLHQS